MAFVARGGLVGARSTLLSHGGWSDLWGLYMTVRPQGQEAEDDGNRAYGCKSGDVGRGKLAVVRGIDVHERREHPEEGTRGHGAVEFVEEPVVVVRVLPRDSTYPDDANEAEEAAEH
jgi:hypothetical protein